MTSVESGKTLKGLDQEDLIEKVFKEVLGNSGRSQDRGEGLSHRGEWQCLCPEVHVGHGVCLGPTDDLGTFLQCGLFFSVSGEVGRCRRRFLLHLSSTPPQFQVKGLLQFPRNTE